MYRWWWCLSHFSSASGSVWLLRTTCIVSITSCHSELFFYAVRVGVHMYCSRHNTCGYRAHQNRVLIYWLNFLIAEMRFGWFDFSPWNREWSDSAVPIFIFFAVFFAGKRVDLAFLLIFSSNKGYLSSDPLLLLGFLTGLMVCLNYFYNLGPFSS